MKKCRKIRMGMVLLIIGMITCFLHTDSIFAENYDFEKKYSVSEKRIEKEVQAFEGEGLPESQWDEKIPVYSSKKQMSGKAITTNPYSGRYGYHTLIHEEQRRAYKLLEDAADVFHYSDMDAVEVSSATGNKKYVAVAVDMGKTITSSAIGEVVVSLIYDHPEYFWSQGYTYYMESADKDAMVTRVTLACHPDYTDGIERADLWEEMNLEIEKYMDLIVGISSDYEKEIILHDALASRVTYAYDENHLAQKARWAHTIEGIFSKEYYSAVCEGYAKAFQVLLNAAGIENVYVVGNANGQGHAWNQVNLAGEWYNVDLTWNDSNNRKNYRYFNLTDEVFGRNHVPFSNRYEITPKVGEWSYLVNVCTSDTYSYEKMGPAKEEPSCKIGLGKIEGAKVRVLNQGVVVTSGSTLTNSDFGTENGKDGYTYTTVTTGIALTIQIVPDYTQGEELQIETTLNGEKTYYSGIGGQEISYTFHLEKDSIFEVSIYAPVQAARFHKNQCTIIGYGKNEKLKVDITPITATNRQIVWKSSKPSVVKVKEGMITSVGKGKATIYAYLENGTIIAKCNVTVKAPYLKIISAKRSVRVGKTINMKAKLYGASGTIKWKVSNKKVAVIGVKSGKLKGKKPGTIWVTAKKGKIEKKIKVTVKK